MLWLIALYVGCIYCTQYAVVVDAGSTSSKIKVYYWDDIKSINQVDLPKNIQKMTALSAYVGKSANLTEDFTAFVENVVPYVKVDLSLVPFYLGATAGLRLLSVEDSEQLIECVRYTISTRFKFIYAARNIRVLSGEEEGVFGWITVQYLDGNFDLKTTTGALDLGGASTQISFIPYDQQILAEKMTFELFGQVVEVYSHSFLKYGNNEALTLANNEIVKKNTTSRVYYHPCLFQGYNYTSDEGYYFRGTSNVPECNVLVRSILHLNEFCPYPNGTCSVDGEYLPILPTPSEQSFYAFSGFEYMPVGLNLNPVGMTLSTLRSTAYQFCANNYEYALENSGLDEPYVWSQCFNVLYGLELLLDGYHFDADTDQVQFVDKVGGKDVGWALGCLLYEQMFT